MKIYTKSGDKGETSLFGGKRLSKDDIRIEAYGTVDELNACLGLCIVHMVDECGVSLMRRVQDRLFAIGSNLASDPNKQLITPDLTESDITELEAGIDRMEEELPHLKNFILPGSCPANAHLHLARTVCRRAERRVLSLHNQRPVDKMILVFLNRLSDYLFVLSRYENFLQEKPEIYWRPRKSD